MNGTDLLNLFLLKSFSRTIPLTVASLATEQQIAIGHPVTVSYLDERLPKCSLAIR